MIISCCKIIFSCSIFCNYSASHLNCKMCAKPSKTMFSTGRTPYQFHVIACWFCHYTNTHMHSYKVLDFRHNFFYSVCICRTLLRCCLCTCANRAAVSVCTYVHTYSHGVYQYSLSWYFVRSFVLSISRFLYVFFSRFLQFLSRSIHAPVHLFPYTHIAFESCCYLVDFCRFFRWFFHRVIESEWVDRPTDRPANQPYVRSLHFIWVDIWIWINQ